MVSNAKLLVEFGFIQGSKKSEIDQKAKRAGKEVKTFLKELDAKECEAYADEEAMEFVRLMKPYKTGFPTPLNAFRIYFESYALSVEAMYFWLLHHVRQDVGYYETYKITDVFTATEQSAFFGNAQQRLGIQQDRASQYLKFISEMLKTLFPLVREARILDEKLSYYNDVYAPKETYKEEKGKNGDMVLKDQWITLVEGGTKNPASVYGMAQQVGFTIIPDLFFRIYIKGSEDETKISQLVDNLEFGNDRVKSTLKRKLAQYVKWRDHTKKELEARKKFIVRYVRQHYMSIRLYINWVKPYLRNIRRMSMNDKVNESAELVSVFDQSFLELEVLAHKPAEGDYYPVMLIHFEYRTVPQMSYQAESYQRGPLHVGKVEMTLRSYVWTKQQIEDYKKYREYEELDLLKDVDVILKDALDALGDDLKKYVDEGNDLFKKEEKKEEKKQNTQGMGQSAFEPFKALYDGFKEMGGGFMPSFNFKANRAAEDEAEKKAADKKNATNAVNFALFFTYKNFKKAHRMLAW